MNGIVNVQVDEELAREGDAYLIAWTPTRSNSAIQVSIRVVGTTTSALRNRLEPAHLSD